MEGCTDFIEAKCAISTLIAWQAGMGNGNRANYHDSCHLLSAHCARHSACISSLHPVTTTREGMEVVSDFLKWS